MVSIFESLTFYLISLITAIFIGLYFYFIRNFKFWQKLGIPYVKPVPFFGNLKDCVFLKTTTGEQLQRIYAENSDKPYVGIFSFDKPSLVIRDLELVKDVLVKDFQTFMDRALSVDEKTDPLFANALSVIKGQLWRNLRTSLTPVFTSGKMKKMFYLLDTCGKELADCLHKATADGKFFQHMYSYETHREIMVWKARKF
jgi:cytochrome P450 family 6